MRREEARSSVTIQHMYALVCTSNPVLVELASDSSHEFYLSIRYLFICFPKTSKLYLNIDQLLTQQNYNIALHNI